MKKSACLFLAWILLSMQLAGCQSKSKTPTEQSQISDTQNSETLQQETLAENFQYEENDNDGITITNYIGDEMNVTIPERIANKVVTCIGKHAFQGKDIQSVDMPDSITEIEYRGFAYNTSLKTVNLSQNLSVIGTEAFIGCSSLANIILPDSLTHISSWAFGKCSSLKAINIPKNSLNEGSASAFNGSGLEVVNLQEQIILPYGIFAHTKLKEIIIPQGVEKIENFSFWSCENLTSIQLNEGLKEIGIQVFANTKIKTIVIPKSVENITDETFGDCHMLTSIYFDGHAPMYYKSSNSYQNDYIVYYHLNSDGFSTPTWNGFKTEIW